jgi:hypothetical protein
MMPLELTLDVVNCLPQREVDGLGRLMTDQRRAERPKLNSKTDVERPLHRVLDDGDNRGRFGVVNQTPLEPAQLGAQSLLLYGTK